MTHSSAPDSASASNSAIKIIEQMGPGLVTGAADDDPSGIATYSQAGAQFGFQLLWVVLFTLPLMIAIQSVCARIGCVTGHGLAGAIKRVFPGWLLGLLVLLLLCANTVNIAADVAAMGEAARLVAPVVSAHAYTAAFGLLSLGLQLFIPYQRYVFMLKWLTLALLAYVAVVFSVKIPWGPALLHTFVPTFKVDGPTITMVVGLLGTTISPYLFFWQSSQEVEDLEARPGGRPLKEAPRQARREIKRIGVDTVTGMAFSELVAFFIILTAAVALNRHGVVNIATAAQAAEALRPIAGNFAFLIFSLGIIGTGLLAVPVLAGSAAYAIAETMGWTSGLNRKVLEARPFYAIIAASVIGGVMLGFTPIDPIKALFYSAVINGVVAAPIMAVTMIVASKREIMGVLVATPLQKAFGWLGTALMSLAAIGMFAGLRGGG
jgi:NRAMP (natural resistance-associated macrophage protein)-like metal ion transporter